MPMFAVFSRNRNYILIGLILLLFIIEFLPTLYRYFGNFDIVRIVGVYKIVFQVALLLLIDCRNLNRKYTYLILCLLLFFSINLFVNPLFPKEFLWLINKGSIYYLDKFIFIFLFVITLSSLNHNGLVVKKALIYIEYFLLFNALLMIIGFVFDIKLFESYITSSRFGYDGIFNKVNEVSHLYSIYLIYLYYRTFILKSNKPILFFIIAFVSLLLGTKTILLFLSLLFVFHFIFVVKKRILYKLIFSFIALTFVIFFEKIIKFLFNLFPFWNHLQEKHGLLTLLFSKRDLLFNNAIDYINANWGIINYFFGGSFYTKKFVITQMDGPDLFLFFGLIGSLIYFRIIVLIYIKKNNTVLNGLIIIIFICGILGGGLLNSAMAMILLFLVSNVLAKDNNIISNV